MPEPIAKSPVQLTVESNLRKVVTIFKYDRQPLKMVKELGFSQNNNVGVSMVKQRTDRDQDVLLEIGEACEYEGHILSQDSAAI
jgi:hypothetical protein